MRHSSVCWAFMSLQSNQRVQCHLCSKTFAYKSSSTSNLLKHVVNNHHQELEVEIERRQLAGEGEGDTFTVSKYKPKKIKVKAVKVVQSQHQSSLQASLMTQSQNVSLPKYGYDLQRKTDVDNSVLQFVTKDLQPLSIVGDEGFRHLISVLDQRYEMISEEQLEEKLMINYNDVKETLINELKSCCKVSLTIDNWSSNNEENYTTISVYYLDEHWKLHSSVLLTDFVENVPSGDNSVSDSIDKAIIQFGLTDKVSTFVTDDNWNLTDSDMKVKLDTTRHHSCLAHTLNFVVSTAINAVEDVKLLIERIQASVLYFWAQTETSNKNKVLIYEQHWVKSLEILEYFLSHFDEISATVCFEPNDRQQVEEVIDVLQPFHEIVTDLLLEKITPASKINPIVKVLKKVCVDNKHPLSIQIYNNICLSFSNVEEETHLIIATLLDPRYKKSGFFSTETATKAVNRLKMILRKDISVGSQIEISKLANDGNNTVVSKDEPSNKKKRSRLWAEFDDEYTRNKQMRCSVDRSAEEKELGLFLEMPAISREDSPFDWWNDHQFRFSNLEKTAKEFLSIPATSIPSCQIFSKDLDSKHKRRALLNRSYVNAMTFLCQNQK